MDEENVIEGNNPCEAHFNFKGDFCPVCLLEERKELNNKFEELKREKEILETRYEEAEKIMEEMRDRIWDVEKYLDTVFIPEGDMKEFFETSKWIIKTILYSGLRKGAD